MGMHLGFHGGKCCGIKTIYGFFNHPYTDEEGALLATSANNNDANGHAVSSGMSFFHEAAPVEKPVERLDRYLKYLRRRRPSGIVEITLAVGGCVDQKEDWEPVLLDRGFRVVNSCKNSNSGNTVFVYHLNMEA